MYITSFTLKIIALITMFLDHFGYAFIGEFSFFNVLGRIAFPIFAFQISEGFLHTKNFKKYLARLGVFALISQIPFSLYYFKFINSKTITLNIFFTLFLGLLAIFVYDYIFSLLKKNTKISNKLSFSLICKFSALFIVLLIAYLAELLNTDYGFWGVLVIFSFYIFKKNKLYYTIAFFLLCIIKYLPLFIKSNYNIVYLILFLFTFLPILFINFYNGKQGYKIKYLLYIFYPLHLFILYYLF